MKPTEKILLLVEGKLSYKKIDFNINKKGSYYIASIDGDEIESTKGKSEDESAKKAKEYIDSIV